MPYARAMLFWILLAAVQCASAEPGRASAASPAAAEFGAQTRNWLELQRSGQAAAPPRSVSGAVASRAYQRYLDSFGHPLPAFFELDAAAASQR